MGLEDRFKIPQASIYSANDLLDAQSFGSLLMEYARGSVTAGGAAGIVDDWLLVTSLTVTEESDLDAIRALIDAGVTQNARILIASQIKDVLVLGERVTTGYTTRAELKAKIGF